MRQSPIGSPRPPVSAVAEVSELIELLEVVWERGRDTVCAPPVSSAQARVLFLVEKNEEINLRTLGGLLGAAPSSVTRLCDRLQAVGFLERNPSPADRRELQLRLTAQGRTYLVDLRARRKEALTEAIAAMPPASRAALAVGLADLREAVSAPLRLPRTLNGAESRTA
ncbi:MarR family winged helix-turn-helix transcriptional regulator [Streptomyces sp. G-G2]|uniref:MarR family winged helix-turn-helix transcriptional regulator n=1 Tax=Streptomyces sp. G-G2 TaxID=3046201 RepID=UPI0024BB6174|nr:MarR family winged helix-turn-helix transcriptional regulator [Streptomyces sp. G-G2]MDJ0382768.1 MarR family winged helix-turn-helix transcriptional regulator [Streptomyces sp. G-G2]